MRLLRMSQRASEGPLKVGRREASRPDSQRCERVLRRFPARRSESRAANDGEKNKPSIPRTVRLRVAIRLRSIPLAKATDELVPAECGETSLPPVRDTTSRDAPIDSNHQAGLNAAEPSCRTWRFVEVGRYRWRSLFDETGPIVRIDEAWASTLAPGDYVWKAGGSSDWNVEVQRFFTSLAALDRELAGEGPFTGSSRKADSGSSCGCADPRWSARDASWDGGHPIRPESYARAEIVTGRVGLAQAAPVRQFDGDASAGT